MSWTSAAGTGTSASLSATTAQTAQSCKDAEFLWMCEAEVETTKRKLSAANKLTDQRQMPRLCAALDSFGCMSIDILLPESEYHARIITKKSKCPQKHYRAGDSRSTFSSRRASPVANCWHRRHSDHAARMGVHLSGFGAVRQHCVGDKPAARGRQFAHLCDFLVSHGPGASAPRPDGIDTSRTSA